MEMDNTNNTEDDNLINSIKEQFPVETNIVCASGCKTNFRVTLHLKCSTQEEFQIWLKEHQKLSGITYRVAATKPSLGVKVAAKRIYRCQHNTYPRSHKVTKSPSKKHTGCPTRLTMTIKSNTQGRCRSTDDLRREYPTIVNLISNHNHDVAGIEAVKYKDPSEEVRQKFLNLFKSCHNPVRALELHRQDLMHEYEEDYCRVATDRSMCPDLSWVYRQHRKFFKKSGDEVKDVLRDVRQKISNIPLEKGKVKMRETQNEFIISACPAFMERVHELDLAGHTVFVDSSSDKHRLNCNALLLMTDSYVGGLPLGFVITSSDSEDSIATGLQMLKEMLPASAFGGRGFDGPEIFMVDDSTAQRNALKTCFPNAEIWLSTFHILQCVWKWLWDSNNYIGEADRTVLYELFKKLVSVEDNQMFSVSVFELLENETAKLYPTFLTYVNKLLNTAQFWGHNFISSSCRNNSDNNLEMGMRVMKDKILNCTRAYNVAQLFEFLFDSLSNYYSRKIVDIINAQYESFLELRYLLPGQKNQNPEDFPFVVEKQQCGLYSVQNLVANTGYDVNVDLGCCTCPVGRNGGPCKHQYAVTRQILHSVQNIVPLRESVRILYNWIARDSNATNSSCAQSLGVANVEENPLCGQAVEVNCDVNPLNLDDNINSDFEDGNSSEVIVPTPISQSQTTSKETRTSEQKLNALMDGIKKGLLNNPKQFSSAIDKAFQRFTAMKTEKEILSALRNFGQVNFENYGASKRSAFVPIQPAPITLIPIQAAPVKFIPIQPAPVADSKVKTVINKKGQQKRRRTKKSTKASPKEEHTYVKK